MRYSAFAIADYFLKKAKACGEHLSPMKLLKLVYFAQCWNLALADKSLIKEPVVAWQYGPVIESLYHEFKEFGNGAIIRHPAVDPSEEEHLSQDDFVRALLDRIWDVYGSYTAVQLSNHTHEIGSPWYTVWHDQDGKGPRNCIINDELIKDYYKKQRKID